jgi:hypothetical protein
MNFPCVGSAVAMLGFRKTMWCGNLGMDWGGVANEFRLFGLEFDLGTGYNSHTRDYGISSSVLK